jgi:hypothetical protein
LSRFPIVFFFFFQFCIIIEGIPARTLGAHTCVARCLPFFPLLNFCSFFFVCFAACTRARRIGKRCVLSTRHWCRQTQAQSDGVERVLVGSGRRKNNNTNNRYHSIIENLIICAFLGLR